MKPKVDFRIPLILTLTTGLNTFASTPVLHFFRTPQSLFPSGQKNLMELEKSKIRSELQQSYWVESNGKSFWLSPHAVLRSQDLPEIGDGKTLIATSLKAQADWNSHSLLQLPAQTQLRILAFEGDWGKVQFHSERVITGYVDLNNVIMGVDFASFALSTEGAWRPVQYRELGALVLDDSQRLPLSKIKEIKTRSELGIVIQPVEEKNLALRSHVLIKKTEADIWSVSQLSGHGEVYWKTSSQYATEGFRPLKKSSDFISTEALLKREIHSVAFHPKLPQIGLVSANGIFYSEDAKRWQRLPLFKDNNEPVSIGPDGELVVGHLWSRNKGKTFLPFLKWEQLTRLIESESQRTPRILKLQEVHYLDNHKLRLMIDTGVARVTVLGDPHSPEISSWRLDHSK